MKILNIMLGRQAIAAALVLSLAIPMSVGAFAKEPALPPRPHRGPLSGVCSPFLKLNRKTAGALCRYDPVGRSCRVWEISENVKFYCAFCLRSCAFFQARNTPILVTMLSG